jgi:hypothetical protein
MVLVVVGAVAPPSARYEVFQGDQRVGEATLRQSIETDGAKVVELTLTLGPDEKPTVVKQSSRVSRDGKPLRKYQEIKTNAAPPSFVIVSFGEASANLLDEIKGVRTQSVVNRDAGLPPVENPSEFWLVRDQPLRGDSVEFSDFDITSRQWRTLRTTYLGTTRVPGIDGPVHKIMSKTQVAPKNPGDPTERLITTFSDSKGQILRMIDTSGFRLERIKVTSIK